MDVKRVTRQTRKRAAKKFPVAVSGKVIKVESDAVTNRPPGRRRGPSRGNKELSEELYVALKREKNRACAKQCRARKKVRYVYLEDVIDETEEKVKRLRKEMKCIKAWGKDLDNGIVPAALVNYRRNCGENGDRQNNKPEIKPVGHRVCTAVDDVKPENISDSVFIAEELLDEVQFGGMLRGPVEEIPKDSKWVDINGYGSRASVDLLQFRLRPLPPFTEIKRLIHGQQTSSSYNNVFTKTEDPPEIEHEKWQLVYNGGNYGYSVQ